MNTKIALVLTLVVVCGGWITVAHAQATTGLAFILDCSLSMEGEKIAEAKSHLITVLTRVLDSTLDTGLCIFGSSYPSCEPATAVAMGASMSAAHRSSVTAAVKGATADKNTPIDSALAHAANMLTAYTTQRILLITDGAETCGGNPAATAAALAASGVDIRIYGVGYGITAEGRQLLQAVTSATGGEYYEGTTASELESALSNAVTAALSALQGWIFIENASTQPVWVYASNEFKSTVSPGDGLRLSSFPGEITVTAVPFLDPAVGQWSQSLMVTAGDTVSARITFGP